MIPNNSKLGRLALSANPGWIGYQNAVRHCGGLLLAIEEARSIACCPYHAWRTASSKLPERASRLGEKVRSDHSLLRPSPGLAQAVRGAGLMFIQTLFTSFDEGLRTATHCGFQLSR